MEVIITVKPDADLPMLSRLMINTGDGINHSVSMKFGFDDLWSFSRDLSSTAFDFLLLAHIVYCVDRAISRNKFSTDGWHRNLRVEGIPVQNFKAMDTSKALFRKAINFLTGDSWNFEFIQGNEINWKNSKAKEFDNSLYESVSLFSGGLDSLIGFVDHASKLPEDKKILLISHKELGKEGGDQKRILEECERKGFFVNKYSRLLLNAGLKNYTWENKLPNEGTFRARSLLFFAAGIYTAHSISPDIKLIVPENGTISLNIPLEKGRRGACSTRTTHPTFIRRIQTALESLGIQNLIINPYQLSSKADMMIDCCKDTQKEDILKHLSHLSCSCAKRSHNRWWDKRGGQVRHCGYCLPCIYRRVALDCVGLDSFDYIGTDIYRNAHFRIDDTSQQRSSDIRSLIYFLTRNLNREYIRRELLNNGVRDVNEIENYIELTFRSYEQVLNWLNKLPK